MLQTISPFQICLGILINLLQILATICHYTGYFSNGAFLIFGHRKSKSIRSEIMIIMVIKKKRKKYNTNSLTVGLF